MNKNAFAMVKKYRFLWLSLIIAVLGGIALIGCSQGIGAEIYETNSGIPDNSDFTRHDYLSLLKTQSNNKVTMDELYSMVNNAITIHSENRSIMSGISGNEITGVKKLPISSKNQFTLPGSGRSAIGGVEKEPVELYEFSIERSGNDSPGFVLASNDIRIGTILAITEGSLENANNNFTAILTANLQDYIDSVILEYNSITDAEITAALKKVSAEEPENARVTINDPGVNPSTGNWQLLATCSDFYEQKSPLLVTNWGQGSLGAYTATGHAYNNYIKYFYGNDYYYAGCGPAAMAQIIAYHNYISPVAPNKPGSFNSSTLGKWTGTYNLSLIRTMNTITNSSPAEAKGQVAALMYQIGKTVKAKYEPGNTIIDMRDAYNAFKSLGYTIMHYGSNATTVTGTSNSFLITYHDSLSTIKTALNSKRPILVRGATQTGGGHFWVIDGYGTMTCRREYFQNTSTNQIIYSTLTVNNALMVHCNLGWDGNDYAKHDGWYIYGIFDTTYRSLIDPVYDITQGDRNYSTGTMILIPAPNTLWRFL
jgi:hypothetical protein